MFDSIGNFNIINLIWVVYCMPHRFIGHVQSLGPSNKDGRARI